MTKTFKKWKSFVNEAQQDKKFIKKFNITVLQKNTPMPPGINPREYHEQIAQQAELGPMFPNTVLAEIEALDDRYFPRENRKVYTKWLANVLLGMLVKHYPDAEIPEGKTLRDIHPSWKGYMEYIQGGEGLPYIVDFLNGAQNVPQQLWNSDWGTMKAAAEDWHEELSHIEDTGEYITKNVVWDFGNGYTIVEVPSKDLETEGNKMGHCVGGYCHFVDVQGNKIYSLRDANNEPHATISYNVDHEGDWSNAGFYEIKGKQNKPPIRKYAKMIVSFIKQNFPEEEYVDVEDFYSLLDDEDLEEFLDKPEFFKYLGNDKRAIGRFRDRPPEFWYGIMDRIIKLKIEDDKKTPAQGTQEDPHHLVYTEPEDIRQEKHSMALMSFSEILRSMWNNEKLGEEIFDGLIDTIDKTKMTLNDKILLGLIAPAENELTSVIPPMARHQGAGGVADSWTPYRDPDRRLSDEEKIPGRIRLYEKLYKQTMLHDEFNQQGIKDEDITYKLNFDRLRLMSGLMRSNLTSPETISDIWTNLTINGGMDPFDDLSYDGPPRSKHSKPTHTKGPAVLREALKNQNLPKNIVLNILQQFIDPETGTLLYEDAATGIDPSTDPHFMAAYGSEGNRPITGEVFKKSLRRETKNQYKAEVAYNLLSSNEGLDPKILELLVKTAIEKDKSNEKNLKDKQELLGRYMAVGTETLSITMRTNQYEGLNFAQHEYDKGGAQWKASLLQNSALPLELAQLLLENSPPRFLSKAVERFRRIGPQDEETQKILYRRSLVGYVNATNQVLKNMELSKEENYNIPIPVHRDVDEGKHARGGDYYDYQYASHYHYRALKQPRESEGGLAQFYHKQVLEYFEVLQSALASGLRKQALSELANEMQNLALDRGRWHPQLKKDISIYEMMIRRDELLRISGLIKRTLKFEGEFMFDEDGRPKEIGTALGSEEARIKRRERRDESTKYEQEHMDRRQQYKWKWVKEEKQNA